MLESRVSPHMKKVVKKRAKNCCEYCWSQEEYSPDSFSIEHITPLSKGGPNTGWFILGGQLGLHFCKEKRCLYFLL
ncbi:HNH endonuclease [Chloroflexi bacterium TSY]|nr:HNH endonuclease [Chloroflexi bacterium TSY]